MAQHQIKSAPILARTTYRKRGQGKIKYRLHCKETVLQEAPAGGGGEVYKTLNYQMYINIKTQM